MPSLKSTMGNSKHISLDDVCFLISVTYEEDELAQQIEVETERQIFCTTTSVTRQEFATAGQLGLKSAKTIIVDADEYDGESLLKYNAQKYSVYRDYRREDGFTELHVEVKIGV